MEKRLAYEAEIPRDIDFLEMQRMMQKTMGYMLADILGADAGTGATGTGIRAAGFPVSNFASPGPFDVAVGAGRVYEWSSVDEEDFGSAGPDATKVVNQFRYVGEVLTLPAPPVGGSRYDLIQVQTVEVDDNDVVVKYYDVDHPTNPLSGPGGSGASQPMDRRKVAVVSVVAGVPAASNPSKPVPDALNGYYALWYVLREDSEASVTPGNFELPTTNIRFGGLTRSHHTGDHADAPKIQLGDETDGTLPLTQLPASITFYDVAGMVPGEPVAATKVFILPVTREFTLAASLAGSVGTCEVAATDAAFSFFVRKVDSADNETNLGTMQFAIGAKSATFSGAGGTLAVGDRMVVISQGVADSTLSDVAFTLAGTL